MLSCREIFNPPSETAGRRRGCHLVTDKEVSCPAASTDAADPRQIHTECIFNKYMLQRTLHPVLPPHAVLRDVNVAV